MSWWRGLKSAVVRIYYFYVFCRLWKLNWEFQRPSFLRFIAIHHHTISSDTLSVKYASIVRGLSNSRAVSVDLKHIHGAPNDWSDLSARLPYAYLILYPPIWWAYLALPAYPGSFSHLILKHQLREEVFTRIKRFEVDLDLLWSVVDGHLES